MCWCLLICYCLFEGEIIIVKFYLREFLSILPTPFYSVLISDVENFAKAVVNYDSDVVLLLHYCCTIGNFPVSVMLVS